MLNMTLFYNLFCSNFLCKYIYIKVNISLLFFCTIRVSYKYYIMNEVFNILSEKKVTRYFKFLISSNFCIMKIRYHFTTEIKIDMYLIYRLI